MKVCSAYKPLANEMIISINDLNITSEDFYNISAMAEATIKQNIEIYMQMKEYFTEKQKSSESAKLNELNRW